MSKRIIRITQAGARQYGSNRPCWDPVTIGHAGVKFYPRAPRQHERKCHTFKWAENFLDFREPGAVTHPFGRGRHIDNTAPGVIPQHLFEMVYVTL